MYLAAGRTHPSLASLQQGMGQSSVRRCQLTWAEPPDGIPAPGLTLSTPCHSQERFTLALGPGPVTASAGRWCAAPLSSFSPGTPRAPPCWSYEPITPSPTSPPGPSSSQLLLAHKDSECQHIAMGTQPHPCWVSVLLRGTWGSPALFSHAGHRSRWLSVMGKVPCSDSRAAGNKCLPHLRLLSGHCHSCPCRFSTHHPVALPGRAQLSLCTVPSSLGSHPRGRGSRVLQPGASSDLLTICSAATWHPRPPHLQRTLPVALAAPPGTQGLGVPPLGDTPAKHKCL